MDSFHYRNPTSIHKRDPVEDEDSINYEEINNSHKSANIRGIQDEKFLEKLHNPVTFNWSQFWVTFLYEKSFAISLGDMPIGDIQRQYSLNN